jgi:DNA-binding CsgD family transcriptional regulator/PAS domain-containing protein
MTEALSPQTLSSLIGSIYDCALDPSRWEQALTAIKDALETRTAVISLSDLPNDRLLIYRTAGMEPYWLQEQAKHLPEMHGTLSRALAEWTSFDEPHVISRHVPRAMVDASPYVQQCLKPQGISDIVQYILMHTPSRLAGFGLGMSDKRGVASDGDLECCGLLLPHIRRAVVISDVLEIATIERSRMAEALNALRCAVVLADARGTILYANGAAEGMLRDGGAVRSIAGRLQTTPGAAAGELRSAIAQAARDETGIGKAGLAIRLTEPDVPPLFAHVLPLTGSDLRTRLQPAAVAAIFIGAPPDAQDSAKMTATVYGLTAAETRVLASLLAGATLAEAAVTLGVAPSTAKAHLDKIFAKTGVSRQADLMRLGARLVPPTKA